MSDLNTLHTTEALSQLLENFQNSEKLKALLSAYVDQIQDVENAVQPIIDARDIDTMTGDRLDGLGEIVDVPRRGQTDDEYRLRLRAELAILNSRGTATDLISVLQLLLGMATADIAHDEYYPKTVYLRSRNFNVGTLDTDTLASLLRRAAPAGTEVHFIFSTTETDDDYSFRFSDTDASTAETGVTHGFDDEIGTNGYGTLNGAS